MPSTDAPGRPQEPAGWAAVLAGVRQLYDDPDMGGEA